MCEKIPKYLRTALAIITAVSVLLAGILFIFSCISIYRSGQRPFSPESVAAHWKTIRFPVIACLLLIVISGGFHLAFPAKASRSKAIRDDAVLLASLKRKAGTLTDETTRLQAAKAERLRILLTPLLILSLAVEAVFVVRFFLENTSFAVEALNREILQGILRFLLSTLLCLGLLLGHGYAYRKCLSRLIGIYKTALAEGKCDGNSHTSIEKNEKHSHLIPRILVAALALAFILLGIFNGGVQDVLGKAIAICTECIGLG